MHEGPCLIDLSEEPPRVHPLRDPTLLGRAADCDVRIDDPLVAGHHAEVRRDGARWVLIDLGSRTGTYLGESRISRAALAHGDELLVGPVRLRFSLGGSARSFSTSGATAGTPSGAPAAPRAAPASERRPSPLSPFQRRATFAAEAPLPGPGEVQDPAGVLAEYEKLRIGLALARDLALEHDRHRILERVVDALLSALSADRALAAVLDDDLRPKDSVARIRGGGAADAQVVVSTTMMSEVLATRQGVLFAGARDDERLGRSRSIAAQNIVSAICVPMLVKDRIVGIVHADAVGGGDRFTTDDLELATVIASQAAFALENAALVLRVEEGTRRENERMRRFLEALPDGVLLLDRAHRVVASNDRALRLLRGLAVHDPEGALSHIGALTVMHAAAQPDKVFDVTDAARPGRILAVSARTDPAAGIAGDVVLVLRDVTAERERDVAAGRAERLALVGRLASNIAHDFNNVLGAVLNYGAFIVDETSEPQVREDASEIVRAAERAADLTAQLLTFGRGDAVRAAVTDIAPIAKGVARLVGGPGASRVAVVPEISPEPMLVVIDPSKLERVLMNLVVNARDASPEGARILVRCAPVRLDADAARAARVAPGDWIRVEVIDHGHGMPDDVAARAFEPFFTTKAPGHGTGLGLASSYGIVTQAGGNIVIDSHQGAGTTVRVFLPPARSASPVTPDRGVPIPALFHPCAVLVVDGDETNRRVIRRLLSDAGHTVHLADDAAAALRIVDSGAPLDVLLTDLTIRGLSGKELAARLTAAHPRAVPVFMSAYYDAATAQGSVLPEEALFLTKPFRRSDLLGALAEALQRRDAAPAPDPAP